MDIFASILLVFMLHVQLHELQCTPLPISTSTSRTIGSPATSTNTSLQQATLDMGASGKEFPCAGDGYRYNKESNSCQKLGEKGTCGKRMIFLGDENNSSIGECDCDYINTLEPLVYHEKSNRCYSIYTQAYCENGSWLVPEGRPPRQFRCVENKCLNHSIAHSINFKELEKPHIVLYKGSCTSMFSEELCSKEGDIVTFNEGSIYPGCGQDNRPCTNNILAHSVAPRGLRCKPGSRRHVVTGKCVQPHLSMNRKP
ncbi:unnamed protein product [Orchesella dallaii]|uniref:DUF4789 domain-containing protein n=1 Tax=Orchesella dallaii TaxID=48710 RepID=A0ABP1QPL7_9HEXA